MLEYVFNYYKEGYDDKKLYNVLKNLMGYVMIDGDVKVYGISDEIIKKYYEKA